MTNQHKEIDFKKVDSLRRHMLLTVSDISKFFEVSRETYYAWQRGNYPRKAKEDFVKGRIRAGLTALENGWPTPEAIAADPQNRLDLLFSFVKALDDDDHE